MTTQATNRDPQIKLNLYDQDYYLWLTETAQLLRQRKLQAVDLDNLVEEIEAMGRSERRAVRSNLRILLMHLLKYKYQPEKRSNSWLFTIREHRKRINESFQDSPSLKKYFTQEFSECYQDGRELAADETGLPIDTFSVAPPFTPEETLNPDYLPK